MRKDEARVLNRNAELNRAARAALPPEADLEPGPDWRALLDEVNSIAFNSDNLPKSRDYWRIREIASRATRSIADERRG